MQSNRATKTMKCCCRALGGVAGYREDRVFDDQNLTYSGLCFRSEAICCVAQSSDGHRGAILHTWVDASSQGTNRLNPRHQLGMLSA